MKYSGRRLEPRYLFTGRRSNLGMVVRPFTNCRATGTDGTFSVIEPAMIVVSDDLLGAGYASITISNARSLLHLPGLPSTLDQTRRIHALPGPQPGSPS